MVYGTRTRGRALLATLAICSGAAGVSAAAPKPAGGGSIGPIFPNVVACDDDGTELTEQASTDFSTPGLQCNWLEYECSLPEDVEGASRNLSPWYPYPELVDILTGSYIDSNIIRQCVGAFRGSTGICSTYNRVFPTTPLREYNAELPAEMRGAFAEASSYSSEFFEDTAHGQLIFWLVDLAASFLPTGVPDPNAGTGGGDLSINNYLTTSAAYDRWAVMFPAQRGSVLHSEWGQRGPVRSKWSPPHTEATYGDSPYFSELRGRGKRTYCAFRAAQRAARQTGFTGRFPNLKVGWSIFNFPLFEAAPFFSIERTEDTGVGDCEGTGMMAQGRQGLRARVFGVDLGDRTGPWALVLGERDTLEGRNENFRYRRRCSGANCRNEYSQDFDDVYRRVDQGSTLIGAATQANMRVRIPLPIAGSPVKIWGSIDYRSAIGNATLGKERRGFSRWSSAWDYRPYSARDSSGDTLSYFTPGTGHSELTVFDAPFNTVRTAVFNTRDFPIPQPEGRTQSGQTLLPGAYARIAANDDRHVRLESENSLGVKASGTVKVAIFEIEAGGGFDLAPEIKLDWREQFVRTSGGIWNLEGPAPYASTLSLTPSAEMDIQLNMFISVWLKFKLCFFACKTFVKELKRWDWDQDLIRLSTEVATEPERLRLMTWTDAMKQKNGGLAPASEVAQWKGHLPSTDGSNPITFAVEEGEQYLSGASNYCLDEQEPALETEIPPVPPGTCNGQTPELDVGVCIEERGFEAWGCSTFNQYSPEVIGPSLRYYFDFNPEASCRYATQWFMCRGIPSGATTIAGGVARRRIHDTDLDQRELDVYVSTCGAATGPDLDRGIDAFLEPRLKICNDGGVIDPDTDIPTLEMDDTSDWADCDEG